MKYIRILLLLNLAFLANASVEPTTGRYVETYEDFSIQVIGGPLTWHREYRERQWIFNRSWESLVFEIDPATDKIRRIIRGGDSYEKLDAAGTVFKFGPRMKIRKNANDTWTWKDRDGNFVEYAANGKTISLHRLEGSFITMLYNGDDKLSGATDSNGNQVLWIEYDLISGEINKVRDYGSRELHYTWEKVDGNSEPVRYKLVNFKDARGFDWKYEYGNSTSRDGRVSLSKIIDPEYRETNITYSGDGRVATIKNGLGYTTTYEFDYLKGKKEYYLKISYPGGQIDEEWYARNGDVKKKSTNGINILTVVNDLRKKIEKDSFGRTTIKEFDEFRNNTKLIYPDGSMIKTSYDVNNSMVVSRVDERGVKLKNLYFSNGLIKTKIEAEGTSAERIKKYTYDEFGQIETEVNVGDQNTEQAITQYTYDSFGNIATKIDAENNLTQFVEYNSIGNILSKIDARGKEWSYTYDNNGNLKSSTNPLNYTTSYTYDKVGNLSIVTNSDMSVIEYYYDDLNNLLEEKNELGFSTFYEYYPNNLISKEVDNNSNVTLFTYDLIGRLIEIENGSSEKVNYKYDDSNLYLPYEVEYPSYTLRFEYDLNGRLVEQTQLKQAGGIQKKLKRIYDPAGNVLASFDEDNKETSYEYDELNRLVTESTPLLEFTIYKYDDRDNLVELKDPLMQVHTITYDRLNRKKTETRPLQESSNYKYDEVGNLVEEYDFKGRLKKYTYDDANQNTKIEYSSSIIDKTVLFTYNKRNSLLSYDDSTTQGVYTYDYLQQKLSESLTYGAEEFNQSFTYSPNGELSSLTTIDNTKYSFFYDSNSNLNNIIIPGEGNIVVEEFLWYQPKRISYPGGIVKKIDYDDFYRIKSIDVLDSNNTNIYHQDYTFSNSGNLLTKNTDHGLLSYTYDSSDRVISGQYPNSENETFEYDEVSNRKQSSSTGDFEWKYNQNNQLLDNNINLFEYDLNGSLTVTKNEDGVVENINEYDFENRLKAIKNHENEVIASYYYDPFGRRLSKSVYDLNNSTSETTYFVYNDYGYAGEKLNGNLISYLFHPQNTWSTDPILKNQNNITYYYQNDHLYTPQIIHNKNGDILKSREMNSFGEWNDIVDLIDDPWAFPGQYIDSESGYYYNNQRYYDPKNGRYIQQDPLGLYDHDNLYQYSYGNPITQYDSNGEVVQFLWPIILWYQRFEYLRCINNCVTNACLSGKSPSGSMVAKCAAKCGLLKMFKKVKGPKKPKSNKKKKRKEKRKQQRKSRKKNR